MHRFRTHSLLLAAGAAALILCGCSKSEEAKPPPATPADAVQARLNDPNVPESEKAEIRKYMNGQGQGTAPAAGTTAGSNSEQNSLPAGETSGSGASQSAAPGGG